MDYLIPPTIYDAPYPTLGLASPTPNSSGISKSETYGSSPAKISDSSYPSSQPARAVVGVNIDTVKGQITGPYTFGQVGSIQIGASTGANIKVSPAGIVATNSSGDTTFALSGTDGSAVFLGTISAGSVIAGSVLTNYLQVGGAASDINGNSTTIDGGKITTNSIAANRIQSNSITSTQINSGYVYAGNISASQITTGILNAETINVTNLNASNITRGTISNSYLPSVITNNVRIGASSSHPFTCYSTSIESNGTLNMGADIGLNNHNINGVNNIYAAHYYSSSDRRLKKFIKNCSYGLEAINELRPVSFKYKKENTVSFGLIAQEVKNILPEVVVNDKKGFLSIKYMEIIPILIKAIQEQQKQIDFVGAFIK